MKEQPGGPEFFGVVKRGGTVFFQLAKGGEDQNCLRVKEGETNGGGDQNFFPKAKGGTRMFLRMKRGNQKKLVTGHHKQTAPLPLGNYSSLT